MADQQDTSQLPRFIGKSGMGNKSTYIAALSTSILALVLILTLWIYNPPYVVLLQNLDASTMSQVSTVLKKNNIAFRYESQSGNIFVPEKSLYHAKFVLGSKGLESNSVSRLLLDTGTPIKPEQISAKHSTGHFALETELAKTIASIDNIQWARVHLAIDDGKSSTGKNNSRASVFVRLAPGRGLGESQIASISHLVASSAANLSAKNVTVIDQTGNLLKSSGDSVPNIASSMQYSYARMLEQSYINKLQDVLAPVFGAKSIRVQVDADIEFNEPETSSVSGNQNQPSHILKKLTTTIVVDNKLVKSDDGTWVSIPRRTTELERVERLVKDTIGFDRQRGDNVHVFNESFGNVYQAEGSQGSFLPEENNSYYLKVLLIALLGFAISYFVLRYLIQKFMEMKPLVLAPEAGAADFVNTDSAESENSDSINASEEPAEAPTVVSTYDALLSKTRQQVNENPAHVARVIKSWVRDNGR